MKVLQIGKFYPLQGGIEKVMYDLWKGLTQRGVECDMLCAANQKKHGLELVTDYGNLICTKTWFKLAATMISPEMIIALKRSCRQYDIIHIHHPDPMACVALACSRYKGKVVLHWHSDILKQKTLLSFYNPLLQWLVRRADIIVGTTPIYVEHSSFLTHSQHKVSYLPIGIKRIVPIQEQVEQIKKRYPGKRIIYSLGRLVEYKGYEYLIEAARYLDDNCVVLIGGDGPLKRTLQQKIVKEGLAEKVKLLGFISNDEFASYFGACDLFCLSSIWKTEAFAIVQVEAMSCGKPIVATKIEGSGVAWVNKDGFSGINVEPCDAKQLASVIRLILSDRQQYTAFAENARKRYESLFTQERMIDNCLAIYRRILENNTI